MLTKNNKLFGCGKNTDGILCNLIEIGESSDLEKPGKLPDIPNDEKVKLLACGYKSVMYLTESHNLYSIGCNHYYECGNRANTDRITQYFKLTIPSNIKITNVVAGENYFLYLGKDEYNKSRLFSIGCNNQGQCGMDSDNSGKFNICKGVENLEFKVIASRNSSSAAVSTKGELYTFGCNEKGNLAQPNVRNVLKPKKVAFFDKFIVDDVSLSHFHMLIICRDEKTGIRKIFSCGSNEFGCLGIRRENSSLIHATPQEISYFSYNEENKRDIIPIKVATSRYQSFVMGLMTKFEDDIVSFERTCNYCKSKLIGGGIFFQNLPLEKNGIKDSIEIKVDIEKEGEKNNLIQINSEKNGTQDKNLNYICENCCVKFNNIQSKKIVDSTKTSLNKTEINVNEKKKRWKMLKNLLL